MSQDLLEYNKYCVQCPNQWTEDWVTVEEFEDVYEAVSRCRALNADQIGNPYRVRRVEKLEYTVVFP